MSQIEVIGPKGLRKSKYDFQEFACQLKMLRTSHRSWNRQAKLITELKLTKLPVKFNPLLICVDNYSVRKTVDRSNYMMQDVSIYSHWLRGTQEK